MALGLLDHADVLTAVMQDPKPSSEAVGAAETMFRDLNRHAAAIVEGLPEVSWLEYGLTHFILAGLSHLIDVAFR